MNTATQTQSSEASRAPITLRENILNALSAFANQRPGIDPMNYGSWSAYCSESRSVTRDLHDFRTLLAAVRWRSGIDAERLQAAFRAYSGRLTCKVDDRVTESLPRGSGTRVTLDYCTGQYFATEYRKAACAVLASALWDYTRDECMPTPVTDPDLPPWENARYDGLSAGDWLRRYFRREFGARLARRYFD